ncbi:MAG: HupE/UreJ family protein [Hyphomicrobiaceae bacterium]|nr:MAG: HupE/UreJ family protein [Hyphomicrobiaceae bacterium]
MKTTTRIISTAIATSILTTPALAHTGVGHTHGLFAGLAHPIAGVDHLLAMLAVGIWSALVMRQRRVWAAPAAFVLAMLAGAALGVAGVALPQVEAGIALSVVALGLMILTRVEMPVAAGAVLAALFALYHGHAHGSEATGAVAAYMAGFAATTATLHIVGIGLGWLLARASYAPRIVGAAIAAFGAYAMAG